MPELPEVQTVIDQLVDSKIVGQRITDTRVYWDRTVAVDGNEGDGNEGGKNGSREFCRHLTGRTILSIYRRGKQIVIAMDDDWFLLVHLRMSGYLYRSMPSLPDPYTRFEAMLENHTLLRYRDPRKFGRCILTRTPDRFLGKLGVEPLSLDSGGFQLAKILSSHRRLIKPLLLDQTVIAGLGNIYVDEALWHARINPLRRSDSLRDAEVSRLNGAIAFVLSQAIRNHGTRLGGGLSNFGVLEGGVQPANQHNLKVFRRKNASCPRCGSTIIKYIVGQRGTHICPKCQPAI